VRQDPDVLDTWFSSGLWPFSTFGWPDRTPELRMFYPTSLLVTGYDILFFWVARMAMLGLHLMRDVPFRDVYIHTLVRDPEGQKMSKTRGNVVDPLVLMDKYGTDALRFTLAGLAAPSVRDVRIAEDRLEAARNFANKLWNASRLVLSNLEGYDAAAAVRVPPDLAARWIASRLAATIAGVRTALAAYRFSDAAATLYQFVWSELCDWYLEAAKVALYQTADPARRLATQHALVTTLETTLRLLHPVMPFITEEIWQRLPHEGDSIMIAPYPKAARRHVDRAAERDMAVVMGVVTAIRTIRGEMRVPPGVTLAATVKAAGAHEALVRAHGPLIEALARASLSVDPQASRPKASALGVVGGTEVFVALEGVVDLAAERQRLTKEIRRAEEAIAFGRAKLARPEFAERAAADIVEKEREKVAAQEALRDKLVASLAWVG
jgi:valyl-tRNA synthetase